MKSWEVREAVVWHEEGGREWWVLTWCLKSTTGGSLSFGLALLSPCFHSWAVIFICGWLFPYVGIHVHMLVVGVDVVHRSGHMVVSCGCGMHHFVGRMHHLWIVYVVWRWRVAGFQWGGGCCA